MSNNEKLSDYEIWEGEVIDRVIALRQCTNGDAQGILEAKDCEVWNCWVGGKTASETATEIINLIQPPIESKGELMAQFVAQNPSIKWSDSSYRNDMTDSICALVNGKSIQVFLPNSKNDNYDNEEINTFLFVSYSETGDPSIRVDSLKDVQTVLEVIAHWQATEGKMIKHSMDQIDVYSDEMEMADFFNDQENISAEDLANFAKMEIGEVIRMNGFVGCFTMIKRTR